MRNDTNKYMITMQARSIVQNEYEWNKWAKEIPDIQFPSDWNIKIIPPFGGAIARFLVNKGKANISIYLDCYGELGAMNEPYWELYPDKDGDNYRVYMKDTEELIREIKLALESNQSYL